MKHLTSIKTQHGVTLLEALLVLVLFSAMIGLMMQFSTQKTTQLRREQSAMKIQQILNAALAYYIANGAWPTSMSAAPIANAGYPSLSAASPSGVGCTFVHSLTANILTANNLFSGISVGNMNADPPAEAFATSYLSPNTLINPYPITEIMDSTPSFYVGPCTSLSPVLNAFGVGQLIVDQTNATAAVAQAAEMADAYIIASLVPNGQVTTFRGGVPMVVSYILPPGQNLNNARSVNFAGVYNPGGCVPQPSCPSGMTPQIFVAVGGVNGFTSPVSNDQTLMPITSFTAYATAGVAAGANPVACETTTSGNTGSGADCSKIQAEANLGHWRVCLQVLGQNGDELNLQPGQYANQELMVFTRCQPAGEPSGNPGSFTVWAS